MKLSLIKLFSLTLVTCLFAACGPKDGTGEPDAMEPEEYPLEECAVSGKTLEDIPEPVTFIYKNLEIKVATEALKADFEADPEKYIAMIRTKAEDETYGKAAAAPAPAP